MSEMTVLADLQLPAFPVSKTKLLGTFDCIFGPEDSKSMATPSIIL